MRKARRQEYTARVLRILQMSNFVVWVTCQAPALLLASFGVVQYDDMLVRHGQDSRAIFGFPRCYDAVFAAAED